MFKNFRDMDVISSSERVARSIGTGRCAKAGEKLVVPHGEKRMSVQVGQEKQRGPSICMGGVGHYA